jgi:hypothetical protein
MHRPMAAGHYSRYEPISFCRPSGCREPNRWNFPR